MRITNYSIVLLFTLFVTRAVSQSNPAAAFKALKAEVQKVDASPSDFPFNQWSDLVAAINELKQDTLSVKRFDYLYSISQVSASSSDKEIRQLAVDIFCRSMGANSVLTASSISHLQKIKQTDFTEASKSYLKTALDAATNNAGALAKVTAFACGNSCLQELQNALYKQDISKRDKKDIKLAQLRAGDTSNEQRLLQSAKEQVLNDNFVYNLIEDLTYTRNKAIFDHLLDLVLVDSKSCTSADNDNPEPMVCAYRLIEQVAPCIDNFPAKVNSYNELESTDYPALLKTVRAWIKENKSSYVLNLNNY